MLDFENCTLLISARSPFARRVRLAFLENGVRFEEKVLDVLKPTAEIWDRNPLARVPTVILKTGEVIFDSNLILQLFYESNKSPLMPPASGTSEEPARRLDTLLWSTLSSGLSEKTVEYFFETQRPESQRDPIVMEELLSISGRILSKADTALSKSESFLTGAAMTQADLDFGAALAYLSFRHSANWKRAHPFCAKLLERLEDRPSFRATVPPPMA